MISILAYSVLAIYTIALFYITVYCVMQFNLLYHYKKYQKGGAAPQTAAQEPLTVNQHGELKRARAATEKTRGRPWYWLMLLLKNGRS